jgi:hypothetical protein
MFAMLLLVAGCADNLGGGVPKNDSGAARGDGGAADGGGDGFGNAHGNHASKDAAIAYSDASLGADAFFINDPQPPVCLPDGGMGPAPMVSGTPECPSDKNREGCPCMVEGEKAACWPGKRENRHHGVCKDGMTQCYPTSEFGLRWGPCEGYMLPKPGAVSGPEACGCFSDGTWAVTDLAPCIYTDSAGGKTYLYSSHLGSKGEIACESVTPPGPPAVPKADWNSSTLKVDCAGHFNLCYTIKAGELSNPKADDCVIVKQCLDVQYPTEGATLPLPNLPAWTSTDGVCGQRFVDVGGYGEMTVEGKSSDCGTIDDGLGNPYVFRRSGYCPQVCHDNPSLAQCQSCSTGGSGTFGG